MPQHARPKDRSMRSNFAVETQTIGRATTLALIGELDLLSSPALEQALDAVAELDADLIIVDLRELDFMDSTGLHVIVEAQHRTRESGQSFALIRGGEQVQRLFDLTGLADALTIVDSPDELLEARGAP
jgi:anti-sigma B factor antagonist